MDDELNKQLEDLDRDFLNKKQDKMADFQDKFKSADGKDASDVLAEYQKNQVAVDRELDKQKLKEADRL